MSRQNNVTIGVHMLGFDLRMNYLPVLDSWYKINFIQNNIMGQCFLNILGLNLLSFLATSQYPQLERYVTSTSKNIFVPIVWNTN